MVRDVFAGSPSKPDEGESISLITPEHLVCACESLFIFSLPADEGGRENGEFL